jgi:hypothetical protein
MTEIRQCWAFNQKGSRCEHPAGHPGDHMVGIQWTDAACAVPDELKPIPYVPTEKPVVETKPESCVACDHMHKAGVCKCGCYEHI